VVAAQVSAVMKRKEEVTKSAVLAFRATRKTVIESVSKLFLRDYHGDSSTVYKWTAVELDAVFEAIVWPSLDVLHEDSIAYPTALLKLLAVWAGNTRYFNLLVKHKKHDPSCYPLAAVVRLLNADRVKGQVVGVVLEMLTNLLTLRPATDEEDEEMDGGTATSEVELEDVTDVLPIDEEYLKKIQSKLFLLISTHIK